MVQIPEYGRRELMSPTMRGGSTINIPENIINRESFVSNTVKPVFSSVKEIAGEYRIAKEKEKIRIEKEKREVAEALKQQKKDRDEAFVAEQMAGYIRWGNEYMSNYKSGHKGKDANNFNTDFSNASEEYVNSINFENEDQRRAFLLKRLGQDTNFYNDATKYSYQEQETYYKNSNNALLFELGQSLSTDTDPQNIASNIYSIYESVSNLNQGQSESFIKEQADKIISPALSSNVTNVSISDPLGSILMLNSDFIKNNMSKEKYLETKGKVIASFKNWAIDKYSRGEVVDFSEILSDPFFNNINREEFKREIQEKGLQLRHSVIQENKERVSIETDRLIYEISKTDDEERKLDLQTELASLPNGAESIYASRQIDTANLNNLYNISNGNIPVEATKDQFNIFLDLNKKIDNGSIKTYAEIKPYITSLTPEQSYSLHGKITNMSKYRTIKNDLKSRGVDIDKISSKSFETETTFKPDEAPYLYKIFNRDLTNKIFEIISSGKELDKDSLNKAAIDVISDMNDPTTTSNRIMQVYNSYYNSIREEDNEDLTQSKRIELLEESLKESDISNILTQKQQKVFAKFLYSGDFESAVAYIDVQSRTIENKNEAQEKRESYDIRPDYTGSLMVGGLGIGNIPPYQEQPVNIAEEEQEEGGLLDNFVNGISYGYEWGDQKFTDFFEGVGDTFFRWR